MASDDLLALVWRANLAGAAAVIAILLLRPVVGRGFGARAAYVLWALAPLAMAASLLPARQVTEVVTPALAAVPTTPAAAEQVARAVSEAVLPSLDWGSLTLAVWAVGAAACLAALAASQFAFHRALGPLRPEAGRLRSVLSGFGPVLLGVVRPRVVLPADFEARFSPDEREVVLAHEQAHLSAGDHLVNAAAAILRCLCWFNPLAHLAVRWLRVDQELACDATVVARHPDRRRSYAEAMLKAQLHPLTAPLACHWPGRGVHPLKRRIARLDAPVPGRTRRAAGLVTVLALCAGAAAAAWAAQPAQVVTVVRGDAPPPSRTAAGARSRELGRSLLEAIDEGYPDSIRRLVDAGADVNRYVPGDGTPLVVAARLGDLPTARLLLAHGAAVGQPAPGDGSPLIMAAAHGRLEMVRLLVDAGADVNQYVPFDETPLINAARHGDLAVVGYLMDRGADPNLAVPSMNRPGEVRSPLSMAADPAVAQYLKSRGARR
jgi:beta-lactamase regulating signal transducer with metallopeptidase domain